MFDWELMSLSHLISPPKAQKSGRNPRFNKAKALNFEAFSESKPLIQTTKRKVGRESNPTQKGFLTHTDTKFKTTHTHTHNEDSKSLEKVTERKEITESNDSLDRNPKRYPKALRLGGSIT